MDGFWKGGDNIPTELAGMRGGDGLLLDPSGTQLYFNDFNRIRKVDLINNRVSTLYGTGQPSSVSYQTS